MRHYSKEQETGRTQINAPSIFSEDALAVAFAPPPSRLCVNLRFPYWTVVPFPTYWVV